jgi:hypothetical protein
MKQASRALAFLAAFLPAMAAAQQFPTVPSGTVIGRTRIGAGPAQAIPISQLLSAVLGGSISVPSVNTNSVVYRGSTSGQATVSAQAVAGTPTLKLPTTTGTLASAATAPIALDSVTGTISCSSCLSVANATPVLTSRAFALTQNLSAIASIQTLGYAAGGDGGGAVFKNVGSTAFLDSFITSFAITGGSGYTNGSYFGVVLVNTTKPYAIGTATVSGGVVTAVNVAGTPGGSCNVGDVYTTGSIPGGSGFIITVTGCSAPLGSFTDSVGTHWQIVSSGAFPNILQFGAKPDWAGTDASATDNFNAIQAGLWFTSYMNQLNAGGGGYWGGRLWVPQGSFLACGTGSASLIVPSGVAFEGASNQGSVIRMCDAFSTSTHFITLCDSNWHFACFNSILRNIQISARISVTAGGSTYMVYSRSTQDFGGLYNVYIYAGGRGGFWFEKGDGGASTFIIDGLSVSAASPLAMVKIGDTVGSGLNVGTTAVTIHNLVLGGPSSGGTYQTGDGLLLFGGFSSVENVHCEEMIICIHVAIPSSTGNGDIVRIHNVNAASGAPAPACTGAIFLDATNNPGNTIIGQVPAGSCSNVVANSQSGGSSRGTAITTDLTFNP